MTMLVIKASVTDCLLFCLRVGCLIVLFTVQRHWWQVIAAAALASTWNDGGKA